MLGGIYTSQRCPICKRLMADNGRDTVCCPDHPEIRASSLIVKFGSVYKRVHDYPTARRLLGGLRYKVDEGTFDGRDYKKANPLGFRSQAERYLEIKGQTVKPGSFAKIRCDLSKAISWFGDENIKTIQYGHIEDFLLGQKDIASKTRQNIKTNLHAFFVWLVRRRELRKEQMPDFPELQVEIGWRKTIDKLTQERILEEVKRITAKKIPRAYIAVRWLATYISVRPGELPGILEGDIDLQSGILTVRNHKTMSHIGPKVVPLLLEDIDFLKSLPRGFPNMPLFRREKGGGGRFAGSAFGKHLLYDVWKKACENLGISGIDLYGGTRHSTMQYLRRKAGLSPEEIKRLSLHTTSKALMRYIEIDPEELRDGYAKARETGCNSETILKPKKQRGDSAKSPQ